MPIITTTTTNNNNNNIMAHNNSSSTAGTEEYPLGTRVDKHMEGMVWFSGDIVQITRVLGPDGKMDTGYTVKYMDGKEEQLKHWEVKERILHQSPDKEMYPLGTRVEKNCADNRWVYGDIVESSQVRNLDEKGDKKCRTWYTVKYVDGKEEVLQHWEVGERILLRRNDGAVPII